MSDAIPVPDGFRVELDLWRDAGATAGLWLRDDDAVTETPPLGRLLSMTEAAGIVPLIAAIPEFAEPGLARVCAGAGAFLAVHGIAHRNNAASGEKKCELGGRRTPDSILADLEVARRRLGDMAGNRLLPVLVPPWNRMAPEIAAGLTDIGLHGLSCFGPVRSELASPDLIVVNTDLDIIDWRGTRRAWPADELYRRLTGHLQDLRRTANDRPTGILTHHLVHDPAAWRFLESLFAATVGHPAVQWLSPADLWEPRDID